MLVRPQLQVANEHPGCILKGRSSVPLKMGEPLIRKVFVINLSSGLISGVRIHDIHEIRCMGIIAMCVQWEMCVWRMLCVRDCSCVFARDVHVRDVLRGAVCCVLGDVLGDAVCML